jgi:L-lactate utilization protein LutC
MSPRDSFLDAVRRAVAAGNRPGDSAAPPDRGGIGYQGGGPDAVARFRDELAAAGGFPHVVADGAAAAARVLSLVHEKGARRVLLGRGAFLDSLGLAARLRELGVEVVSPGGLTPATSRDPFFAADVGVTGVDHLVAETGSVILFANPTGPRSPSLLPPVHVAVAHAGQLLPDLFDLFGPGVAQPPPSCVSIVTGPSKTGDIELKLVTGVHGPGELHVVVAGS